MIITIEGPTGAGKTAISLEIAQALNTQILNCDSRQIYKYMDIGTAKPNIHEQWQVTHHLIDIITPDETFNAGLWVKAADNVIQSLQDNDKIPLVCGGTGLWIRSLLEGLFHHPPLDPTYREVLKEELSYKGLDVLYKELSEVDPAFAKRISRNDSQRILRGLEIYRATNKSLSDHWAEQSRSPRYSAFRILVCPDRDALYKRINQRLDMMINLGLLDEISALLDRGYSWDDPGLNSLGYKEFRAFFESHGSLTEAVDLAKQHHRNYAKRQITWYRKQNFDLTLNPFSFNLSEVLKAIDARLLR
nr:tRNA dimethylallyltransferase [Candidatus Cloacimonadota bacterium]